MSVKMPEGLEYWTADEVAECVDYERFMPEGKSWRELYSKLWRILAESKNPTPLGGDGSNGTVEYPCGRRSLQNDDKARHWWDKLEEFEQSAIAQGFEQDMR